MLLALLRLLVLHAGVLAVAGQTQSPHVAVSSTLGIQFCKLDLESAFFADQRLNATHRGRFSIHLFLKLSISGSKLRVRGFTFTDNPHAIARDLPDLYYDPMITLGQHGVSKLLLVNASFPQSSAHHTNRIAALPRSLAQQTLELTGDGFGGTGLEYELRSGASEQHCIIRALDEHDPLGKVASLDVSQAPNRAAVVMSPFYDVGNNLEVIAALLDRHIQYHALIGFNQHVLYVRQPDLDMLSTHPRISRWIESGHFLLVLWHEVPFHPGKPYYDQRLVYCHALLAFSHSPIYLAMLDVDEYLCSNDAGPTSMKDVISRCTHASTRSVNVKVTRFNVAAEHWNLSKAEWPLWMSDTPVQDHPIKRYKLINKKWPSEVKSIVRPEFIRTMYIHHASTYNRFNATRSDPSCLHIIHLKNLFDAREHRTLYFHKDRSWNRMLSHTATRLATASSARWATRNPA